MTRHGFKAQDESKGRFFGYMGNAEIHLTDNKTAIIDGAKGVVEYTPCCVRLDIGRMYLRFCGREMTIKTLSDDKIIVEGIIASIDFSS